MTGFFYEVLMINPYFHSFFSEDVLSILANVDVSLQNWHV
jgi:hypothetical protein